MGFDNAFFSLSLIVTGCELYSDSFLYHYQLRQSTLLCASVLIPRVPFTFW